MLTLSKLPLSHPQIPGVALTKTPRAKYSRLALIKSEQKKNKSGKPLPRTENRAPKLPKKELSRKPDLAQKKRSPRRRRPAIIKENQPPLLAERQEQARAAHVDRSNFRPRSPALLPPQGRRSERFAAAAAAAVDFLSVNGRTRRV